MNVDHITKLANHYLRQVNAGTYDANLRNLIINTPPIPDGMSFRDAAEVVIEDLSSLDPSGKDTTIIAPIHLLMDILNNVAIPEANSLLEATRSAYSIMQNKARADRQKNMNAKYLSNLSKVLVYKYYQPGQEKLKEQGEDTKQAPSAMQVQPKEDVVKFLQRIFRLLKSGGKPTANDITIWKSYRGQLIGRLDALNKLQARTPRQEEERSVIGLVKGRLG